MQQSLLLLALSRQSAGGDLFGNPNALFRAAAILLSLIPVLLFLLIFAVLAFTVFKDNFNFGSGNNTTTVSQTEAQPVAVPEFTGRSYLDISSNPVFKANFKFEAQYVNNDEINEGYIVTQSIAADTMVQPGTTITLYVSKGKEKIVLPDVKGYDYEEAEKRLTELGFICEKIETREGSYRENEVVSMAPVAEQGYYKNTTVYLRVFVAENEPVTDEFGNIVETEETTSEEATTEF
jgi:serine/threonine-protein kinase